MAGAVKTARDRLIGKASNVPGDDPAMERRARRTMRFMVAAPADAEAGCSEAHPSSGQPLGCDPRNWRPGHRCHLMKPSAADETHSWSMSLQPDRRDQVKLGPVPRLVGRTGCSPCWSGCAAGPAVSGSRSGRHIPCLEAMNYLRRHAPFLWIGFPVAVQINAQSRLQPILSDRIKDPVPNRDYADNSKVNSLPLSRFFCFLLKTKKHLLTCRSAAEVTAIDSFSSVAS